MIEIPVDLVRSLKATTINYKILLQEKIDYDQSEDPELTKRVINRVDRLLEEVNDQLKGKLKNE